MEKGRIEIINNSNQKEEKKEILKCGQVVYCKGNAGTGSFYGIVYEYGVLELPYGSNAYINTKKNLHLGDTINYWTIDKVFKNVKLIIED